MDLRCFGRGGEVSAQGCNGMAHSVTRDLLRGIAMTLFIRPHSRYETDHRSPLSKEELRATQNKWRYW